jgi:hypothetical protein
MLWLPLWEDSLHSTELPKTTEPRGQRQIRTHHSFAGGSLLNTEVKAGKILHSLLTIHSSERSSITLQSVAVTMTACEESRSPDFPEDGHWKVFFANMGAWGLSMRPLRVQPVRRYPGCCMKAYGWHLGIFITGSLSRNGLRYLEDVHALRSVCSTRSHQDVSISCSTHHDMTSITFSTRDAGGMFTRNLGGPLVFSNEKLMCRSNDGSSKATKQSQQASAKETRCH